MNEKISLRDYTVYEDEPKANGASSGNREREQQRAQKNGGADQGTNQRGAASDGRHHERRDADGKNSAGEAESDQNWNDPDWSILDDRRGELPDFPLDTLPLQCADWVRRAAHGAGVTVDHVAVPFLGTASSLIGTARRAMASRSWSQPMTVWTALVGFSGSGKTPGIDVTKRALSQIDRNRKPEIARLQLDHDTRAEVAKAARAKWKKEVEAAVEEGEEPPKMPVAAIDPGPFIAPRLYVSDATIERIGVLLQGRQSGMLMLSDELASLFSNMSRYSRGQDNEFWLECWNGNQYTIERMMRPSLRIDHLLVGVVGGLQPDKLAKSFDGAADGMYARFLFAWPPEAPYRPLSNEVAEIEPEILNALKRIIDMPAVVEGAFAARPVGLSDQALVVFEQLRQFVHSGRDGLDGREREWWAKMPAHVLRLAGTLSFIGWAFAPEPEPTQIEVEHVRAAVRLVRDYFWPHARAALRQIGLSQRHVDVRRALRWIKVHSKKEVSLEEIRREALSQKLDAEQTAVVMAAMEKFGFAREITAPSGPKGGRPRRRWQINPALFAKTTAETAETPS